MAPTEFPPVPLKLLESLERAFRDTLPPEGTSVDRLHVLIGQQSVIRFLRHQYAEQNTTTFHNED